MRSPFPSTPPKRRPNSPPEQEFEEIWRFRRLKPKFERPQGQDRRHNRHPGGGAERGRRPHHERQGRPQPPATAQAGPQQPSQAEGRKEPGAPGGQGEHGRRHGGHNDRHRHHRQDGDRRERPHNQGPQAGTAPAAKAEGVEQRAGGGAQQSRPPQRDRNDRPHDRPHDRGRDSRPPRSQGRIAASAAPKRSAGVDPDSPFAALSQLKERLEKQLQTQDETI